MLSGAQREEIKTSDQTTTIAKAEVIEFGSFGQCKANVYSVCLSIARLRLPEALVMTQKSFVFENIVLNGFM